MLIDEETTPFALAHGQPTPQNNSSRDTSQNSLNANHSDDDAHGWSESNSDFQTNQSMGSAATEDSYQKRGVGKAGQRYPGEESKGSSLRLIFNEVLSQPQRIYTYFSRLSSAFGLKYVLFVMFVYGVNQGVGETWSSVATNFYFSDPVPKGINLSEERAQKILGFANVPWQVKSIYGIVSDLIPIRGLKRTPYIFIAGIVGFISWISLWLFELDADNLLLIGILLFFGSFSIASPDVMIDASVAERCRVYPTFASDLQTLCWGSFAVGAILSSLTGGRLYEMFTSRGLFGINSTTGLIILLPSYYGWLKEKPVSQSGKRTYEPIAGSTQVGNGETIGDFNIPNGKGTSEPRSSVQLSVWQRLRAALNDSEQGAIIKMSLVFLIVSFGLGTLAELNFSTPVLVFVTFLVTVFVTWLVCYFEYRISTTLAKASVYIFLSAAMQPSSVIISYWVRDVYPNCQEDASEFNLQLSPCFSATFITNLSVVGYGCFLIGTACYNRYFSLWPYKKIYFWSQLSLFLCGFLDLILVSRLNLVFGIPDYVFILGDEAISDIIGRLNTMPLFILAASVCPEGIEATLFAFNMGLGNFGANVASYYGMGLLHWLDLSHETGFTNLRTYVFVRTLFRLVPLMLIPVLLPDGSPSDSLLPTQPEKSSKVGAEHGEEEADVHVEMQAKQFA